MSNQIVIYGKSACPFTRAAMEEMTNKGIPFTYIDVVENPAELDVMLKYSNGDRRVPLIVDGETITTGFKGKS